MPLTEFFSHHPKAANDIVRQTSVWVSALLASLIGLFSDFCATRTLCAPKLACSAAPILRAGQA